MTTRGPLAGGRLAAERTAPDASHATAWTVLTALVATAAAFMAAHLPPALVLPAMSLLMILAGLALAAGSWFARGGMAQDFGMAREIAGILVFFGFAAAMLTDKADALTALARLEAQSLAVLLR